MFDTGVVDRLIGRARELNQLHAALLADLVAVLDATPKPDYAALEISTALTWTHQAATTQLDLAYSIVRQFPLLHAMASGDVDLPKARVIIDGVLALDPGPSPLHRGRDPAPSTRADHRRAAHPAGQTGHPGRP